MPVPLPVTTLALLEAGSDVNAGHMEGCRPLHVASAVNAGEDVAAEDVKAVVGLLLAEPSLGLGGWAHLQDTPWTCWLGMRAGTLPQT